MKLRRNLKKDLKYLPIGRGLSITEGLARNKEEMTKRISEINDKINLIFNMTIIGYLNQQTKLDKYFILKMEIIKKIQIYIFLKF